MNTSAQCDPGQNIADLRAAVRKNLFAPKKYSQSMNAVAVCRAFKKCINPAPKMFPPMRRVTVGDTIMYIDPDSPLSASDYLKLLKRSALKTDINRIAKKLGLLYRPEDTKDVTKSTIISHLVSLKIAEPIVDSIKKQTKNKNNNSLGNFGGNFQPPMNVNGLPPANVNGLPPANVNGPPPANVNGPPPPANVNVSFFKPGMRPKIKYPVRTDPVLSPASRNGDGRQSAENVKAKLLADLSNIKKGISS